MASMRALWMLYASGLLCIFVFLASTPSSSAQPLTADQIYENSTRLRNELLSTYVNTLPPGGGVKVAIQLALYQIVEVSTPLQTIKFTGWWRHYWTDKRMSWDADKWGVESLVFSFAEIWVPDDLIYELIDDLPIGDAVVTAYPSGSMFYSRPRVSVVKCPMQLLSFPFDTQTCAFNVGSLAYDASMVDVLPRTVGDTWYEDPPEGETKAGLSGIDLQSFSSNPEYALARVKVVSKNFFYSCCIYPYPILRFEFTVVRMSLTYLTGILIPLVVVSFVGFFALLMPSPLSGARPTLSVGILYTSSAIYLVAAESMPQIGTFTVIGRVYTASLIFSVFMILVSILTTGVNLVIAEDKQHRADLMSMFRHFDADKSGTLDVKEADNALNSLGLNQFERNSILLECSMDAQKVVTADEWIQMAELARKYRPSTQYNVFIGKLIRLLTGFAYKEKYRKEFEAQNQIMSESFRKAPSHAKQEAARHFKLFGSSHADDFDNDTRKSPRSPTTPKSPEKNGAKRVNVPGMQTELVHGWAFGNGSAQPDSNGNGSTHPDADPAKLDTYDTVLALVDHPLNPGGVSPYLGLSNGGTSPQRQDDFSSVGEWLHKLECGEDVFFRFQEEEVDLEALSEMKPENLVALGVHKIGHQLKLIKWAREKLLMTEESRKAAKQAMVHRRNSMRDQGIDQTPLERTRSGHFRPTGPYKINSVGSLPDTSGVTKEFLAKHEIKVSGKAAHNVKHLGAVIDWWSVIIFPILFIIYLVVEFLGMQPTGDTVDGRPRFRLTPRYSGGFIPDHGAVSILQPDSAQVSTLVQFINERALDGTGLTKANETSKSQVCFMNIQANLAKNEEHACDQLDHTYAQDKTLILTGNK